MNPQNDTLDNLVTYIQEHTQAFLKLSSVRCRFDLPDHLPGRPLSSDLRHNLFLVIKEALNNIAKHAAASEVSFRMKLTDSMLTFSIEDNGRGFDAKEVSAMANGLSNMKKRMKQLGGSLEVTSVCGKGTTITLRLSLGTEA